MYVHKEHSSSPLCAQFNADYSIARSGKGQEVFAKDKFGQTVNKLKPS